MLPKIALITILTDAELLANGAVAVQPPDDMPWGQRTAFFADPDGNIHELFADLPAEKTE